MTFDHTVLVEMFTYGIAFGFGGSLLMGLTGWGISAVCRLFIKIIGKEG